MIRNGISGSTSGGNKVASIYEIAIKSASSTVGVANRKDPNSLLQFSSKEGTIKMHHTGDMATKGDAVNNSITASM